MSDIVDKANDLAEIQLKHALAGVTVYRGVSAITCADCGGPIPPQRRIALPGVERCVDCQQQLEMRRLV